MANNLGLFGGGGGLAEGVAPPIIPLLSLPLTPDQVDQMAQGANARKVRDEGEGANRRGRGIVQGPSRRGRDVPEGGRGRGRLCPPGFRGELFGRPCRPGFERGARAKRSLGIWDRFSGQDGALDSAVGSADKRQVREAEANFKSDDMIHQQLESINKKMEQISADLESKEK